MFFNKIICILSWNEPHHNYCARVSNWPVFWPLSIISKYSTLELFPFLLLLPPSIVLSRWFPPMPSTKKRSSMSNPSHFPRCHRRCQISWKLCLLHTFQRFLTGLRFRVWGPPPSELHLRGLFPCCVAQRSIGNYLIATQIIEIVRKHRQG